MLPRSGRPLCGRGLTSSSGSGRRTRRGRDTAAPTALLGSRGPGPAPQHLVNTLDCPSPDGGGARVDLRPRCLVCGLASQLLSLITDKTKSFEFKESNHCSCYEATIWKASVDFLLKESSVPFHTSLSHCVTFSVLSFFFFSSLEHMPQSNYKYSSPPSGKAHSPQNSAGAVEDALYFTFLRPHVCATLCCLSCLLITSWKRVFKINFHGSQGFSASSWTSA